MKDLKPIENVFGQYEPKPIFKEGQYYYLLFEKEMPEDLISMIQLIIGDNGDAVVHPNGAGFSFKVKGKIDD